MHVTLKMTSTVIWIACIYFVSLATRSYANNSEDADLLMLCKGNCSELPASCYVCTVNDDCVYGTDVHFNCTVPSNFECKGPKELQKQFQCRYCYLTDPKEHKCSQTNSTCSVYASPPPLVKATCETNEDVFCLGSREFKKMVPCNWTSGYSWIISVVLSVTLGGFGVDRFYLGYWKEGLGKFFSFGGIGIWTLIDFFLIVTGYLTPSDGSLYVW